jgi:hypothetical protein
VGAAEVALEVFLGVAAFLVADDDTRRPPMRAKPPGIEASSPMWRSPCNSQKSVKAARRNRA